MSGFVPNLNLRSAPLKEPRVEVDKRCVDEASRTPDSGEARRRVIYVFTVCEYGGGEIASCRLTCGEAFADGFEVGVRMHIDEDTHYVVRRRSAKATTPTTASARAVARGGLKSSDVLASSEAMR